MGKATQLIFYKTIANTELLNSQKKLVSYIESVENKQFTKINSCDVDVLAKSHFMNQQCTHSEDTAFQEIKVSMYTKLE